MSHSKDFISGHSVKLVHGGTEYFDALLELMESAVESLHLQVYILESDNTGEVIVDALREAASRGVKVYLVVDGFGSLNLGASFKEKMRNYGINFRFFSPLSFRGLFHSGRRLHHKVCVADSKTALVAGINIADKYSGFGGKVPWLDYGVLVSGPVASQINLVCDRIFNRRFNRRQLISDRKSIPLPGTKEGVSVRITINDWLRRMNEISAGYKLMLNRADHEIIIVASYFIPSRRLLKILVRSAKRNRKIFLVVSRNSDVPFMKPAMAFLYNRLLENNIRIFEYEEAVLHAKVCVVDNRWVSIGSHNLNHLSEFLSIEMNLEVMDKKFSEEVALELKSLMQEKCIEIKSGDVMKSKFFATRLMNWISYKIISWSMRILFFLNIKPGKDA